MIHARHYFDASSSSSFLFPFNTIHSARQPSAEACAMAAAFQFQPPAHFGGLPQWGHACVSPLPILRDGRPIRGRRARLALGIYFSAETISRDIADFTKYFSMR